VFGVQCFVSSLSCPLFRRGVPQPFIFRPCRPHPSWRSRIIPSPCIPFGALCPPSWGRVSAYQPAFLVDDAQAHIDPYSLSLGIHSRTHQPKPRWTWAGKGPERTRPDRYQRQDTAATSNRVVPIASMGHTGFHFTAAESVPFNHFGC